MITEQQRNKLRRRKHLGWWLVAFISFGWITLERVYGRNEDDAVVKGTKSSLERKRGWNFLSVSRAGDVQEDKKLMGELDKEWEKRKLEALRMEAFRLKENKDGTFTREKEKKKKKDNGDSDW